MSGVLVVVVLALVVLPVVLGVFVVLGIVLARQSRSAAGGGAPGGAGTTGYRGPSTTWRHEHDEDDTRH